MLYESVMISFECGSIWHSWLSWLNSLMSPAHVCSYLATTLPDGRSSYSSEFV